MFGSQIQILTREKEKAKDEKVSDANKIYELLKIPKLKLGDRLANVLGTEGEKILEDNLLQAKELEDKNIEQIKEEYEFDKIKDVNRNLIFFYGGGCLSENFKHVCNFLLLNDENIGFLDFVCLDKVQNIMTNNSLSIYVQSGNIFYQNFNINENFYNVLNKTKQNQ